MGETTPCDGNTASGYAALCQNTTGGNNTAIGNVALNENKTGSGNTGIGMGAMWHLEGSNNIAIGQEAGSAVPSDRETWWNIWVGNEGTEDDAGVIRIGTAGHQSRTWIAGITDTSLTAGSVVGVASDGQLGVLPQDLLPKGDTGPAGPHGLQGDLGPAGPMGPQGPAGSGLVPGSLLFLPSTINPPAGYVLLGRTDLALTAVGGVKPPKLTIYVYQKR